MSDKRRFADRAVKAEMGLLEACDNLDLAEAEVKRLREQDEVHWKTRRHLVSEVERLRAALAPFARITTPKGPHVVDVDWGATLELADLERARRALEGSSDE